MDITVVIPAYNPDDKLIRLLKDLTEKGFRHILLVDDGSKASCQPIFEQAKKYQNCMVIRHCVNQGKGRALKDAFNFVLNNLPGSPGVVTVDADGQHAVDDIVKCARMVEKHERALILGVRDFNRNNIPVRNKFGNKISAFVYKAVLGMAISDTQTGLRGIPAAILPCFLGLKGERFEYETNMLIEARQKNIRILEQDIKTIYDKDNKSHFNPLLDSFRIYALLIKYAISSVLAALIDIGLFGAFMILFAGLELPWRILLSTALARALSSLLNYYTNRNLVFNSAVKKRVSILRYYALCALLLMLSFAGVYAFTSLTGFPSVVVKIAVDLVLFVVGYNLQREWVFRTG